MIRKGETNFDLVREISLEIYRYKILCHNFSQDKRRILSIIYSTLNGFSSRLYNSIFLIYISCLKFLKRLKKDWIYQDLVKFKLGLILSSFYISKFQSSKEAWEEVNNQVSENKSFQNQATVDLPLIRSYTNLHEIMKWFENYDRIKDKFRLEIGIKLWKPNGINGLDTMHLKTGMACKSVTQGGIVSRIVVPLIRTKIRSMGLTTIVAGVVSLPDPVEICFGGN